MRPFPLVSYRLQSTHLVPEKHFSLGCINYYSTFGVKITDTVLYVIVKNNLAIKRHCAV